MAAPDSQDLAGVRVVLLRTPARSAGLAAELTRRGATPLCLPLIDFERPVDTVRLEGALERLAAGGYDWLVVTSATTVLALEALTKASGTALAVPEGTRTAAVGEATARALSRAAVPAALIPADSSARGLLEEFPAGPGTVLLPQASLAENTLADGLAARGWQVDRIEAYRTVDYPADPALRLPEGPGEAEESAAGPGLLDPAGFRELAASAGVDAVVLTSPSTVRRFSGMLERGLPAGVAAVAIGHSTAAEAAGVGLHLDATAASPTPRGVADAVLSAVHRVRESSTNGVIP